MKYVTPHLSFTFGGGGGGQGELSNTCNEISLAFLPTLLFSKKSEKYVFNHSCMFMNTCEKISKFMHAENILNFYKFIPCSCLDNTNCLWMAVFINVKFPPFIVSANRN